MRCADMSRVRMNRGLGEVQGVRAGYGFVTTVGPGVGARVKF